MEKKVITADFLIDLLQYRRTSKKGYRFYFRGEKPIEDNKRYNLQPTLSRKEIHEPLREVWGKSKSLKDIESLLFKRYMRYTAHLIESDGEFAGRTLKELEILCLAQHHGLPTLLMDWTLNPLVALYFAIAREDTGDLVNGHGKLWVMKLKQREKRPKMTIHLEDPLSNNEIEGMINNSIEHRNPLLVVPLVFTKRIAAQEGRFIYCPFANNKDFDLEKMDPNDTPWESLECYKVSKSETEKRKILEVLTFLGFHAGRIFPDLSGWAKYLRQGNT